MKFLIIQTAFIGDVVLATALIEKLHAFYPDASIDFLLRKGNESLLTGHPYLRQVWILDKKKRKYRNLLKLIKDIRKEKYDYVLNAQRFFASGLLTAFSGAKNTIGFDKNPLSFLYSQSFKHRISTSDVDNHEVKRNLFLIEQITDKTFVRPKLYPSTDDFKKVATIDEYICIAPASIWFTKQFPVERWAELIQKIPERYSIFLLGAKSDIDLCNHLLSLIVNRKSKIVNYAGQLSFLESAALMKHAHMNFVNDSAPLHFASAVNAPVSAIFCSTVPAFGFGPLSDTSFIFETCEALDCRPCGLHGYKACPKGHFKCSHIHVDKIIQTVFP